MQPATIVAQRQATVVSSQAIPITKVFPSQEGQQQVAQNLYIHPVSSATRRSSPGKFFNLQITNILFYIFISIHNRFLF